LYAIPVDWLPDCFVGIIQRRRGYLTPAARTFLDLLEQHVAERWGDCSKFGNVFWIPHWGCKKTYFWCNSPHFDAMYGAI